ncbi:hypothetical protein EL06_24920 [Salmonella enterica subsp. diarizonae]|uniref:Uncharacterized protein n=1 Tax=Salmonella diarizonae TaxID=59204 RepID=A0A6C8Y515_SALDZ|nr:hypothetical protein [Salmonella enterica subsp. diarizonae]
MAVITAAYVKRLEIFGVKIIESHLHSNAGHVVIADVVHCSNGRGKKWQEERSLTLRSNKEIFEYLQAIA